MRLLIVTQYFWPEDFRINDLAAGLAEKGHDVTVLTGIPNYPGGRYFPGYGMTGRRREEYRGVKVMRAPLALRGSGGGFRLAANYLSFAAGACLWGPFLCRGMFDIIFVYEPSPVTVGLPALLLKRLKKAPLMFWVQDLWPESLSAAGAVRSRPVLALAERLVRFIYGGCDRVLVQSRAFVPPTERLGVEPKRILYFPNSAEAWYRPVRLEEDAPEREAVPPGFRVMFAGNIGAAQDFGTILDAAERLRERREIRWLIVGDGRMRPWVEAQVRERGLSGSVHLLGRRPAEEMPRFLSLADVLLVTLRREPIFALTIPSKLQSYLACGRPVIAALDGEGSRVVREAGAGISLPAEDPAALAEAVLAMFRAPEAERRAMGERGRAFYEAHFERGVLLDRLEGWMMDLLAEAKGR